MTAKRPRLGCRGRLPAVPLLDLAPLVLAVARQQLPEYVQAVAASYLNWDACRAEHGGVAFDGPHGGDGPGQAVAVIWCAGAGGSRAGAAMLPRVGRR